MGGDKESEGSKTSSEEQQLTHKQTLSDDGDDQEMMLGLRLGFSLTLIAASRGTGDVRVEIITLNEKVILLGNSLEYLPFLYFCLVHC